MLKVILSILTLTLYSEVFGQTDYAKFVIADNVERKQVVSTSDGSSDEIIYLGEIKDKNGETIYHVLTVFRLVQAAIVKHGHAEVVFLDKSLGLTKKYNLGLPEELPFMLKDNSLSFYYTEEKTKDRKIFQREINRQLPSLLCVSPNVCY
jgi:hypothetical protein